MEWQPIETAPLKGSFDVWAKKWNAAKDIFEYRRFPDCDTYSDGGIRVWEGNIGRSIHEKGYHATHWMKVTPP